MMVEGAGGLGRRWWSIKERICRRESVCSREELVDRGRSGWSSEERMADGGACGRRGRSVWSMEECVVKGGAFGRGRSL